MVKETVYERRGRGRAVARILGGVVRKLRSAEGALVDAYGAAFAIEGSGGGDAPTAPFGDLMTITTTDVHKATISSVALYDLARELVATPMPKTGHGDRREYDAADDGTPAGDQNEGETE